MSKFDYFTVRVIVENHVDRTSYNIAYDSNERITRDIIANRIRNDIIGLTKTIRVNNTNDIFVACVELNEECTVATFYNKIKVSALWHTVATIAINIKKSPLTILTDLSDY